ncbi:MAG: crotonase/enoyl-CoA hydratase family protein [Gammaproteobacteria bacterium]
MSGFNDLLQRRLRHLRVAYDQNSRAVWVEFKYQHRPCFSRGMLDDLSTVQRVIKQIVYTGYRQGQSNRLLFQIIASTDKRVFNLGGDLAYFIRLIGAGNRDGLRQYAKTCIDIQYTSLTHYGVPFTTLALVEGTALGGGFEAALSANILIAETRARFGFPEVSFGLFPGMGALSLLIRRINPAMARRLIMDHRVYTASELYELGVVDILVQDGQGRKAAADYIRRNINKVHGLHGFQAAIDRVLPVTYDELNDIVELWVDNALQLSEKNRRLMAYFARAQTKRFATADSLIKEENSKLING